MKRNNQSNKNNNIVVNFNRKIVDFFRYVRNYKNSKDEEKNKDLREIRLHNKIEKLEKEVEERKRINLEKDNLIQLREQRLDELNKKYSELKKTIKKLDEMNIQRENEISMLKTDVRTKEHQRRANASSIGAKQKSINSLNKKLEAYKEELSIMTKENSKQIKEIKELRETIKKNEKIIEFYKSNRKNPTVEEVKAYDFQFKEVEKRSKNES